MQASCLSSFSEHSKWLQHTVPLRATHRQERHFLTWLRPVSQPISRYGIVVLAVTGVAGSRAQAGSIHARTQANAASQVSLLSDYRQYKTLDRRYDLGIADRTSTTCFACCGSCIVWS